MKIKINPDGTAFLLYTEDIPIEELGKTNHIKRLFHVEPTPDNEWIATVDLSSAFHPGALACVVLGPFEKRSDALAAEVEWIEENILY